jgi:exopolysaccharide biosynthesis predicted pyruvyltransferase EpsI
VTVAIISDSSVLAVRPFEIVSVAELDAIARRCAFGRRGCVGVPEVPNRLSPRSQEAFDSFRREIDAALDAQLDPDANAALLHFPYDSNVGNHMLWVAATDYLADRRIRVRYVAHTNNFHLRELGGAIGNGTILLLGGVSRLWPQEAALKREVARAFPRNALIVLPTTVLFLDDDDRREASTIFGDHRRVTLLTRDARSEAEARRAFPKNVRIVTVPDLALRLSPQPSRGTPAHKILWVARNDHEAAGIAPPPSVHVVDWPPQVRGEMTKAYCLLRASGALSHVRSSVAGAFAATACNAAIHRLYRRAAAEVLRRGNTILDTGQIVVTDRMHAHLLAALRGQPVVLLPDKLGKNRAVYENFSHRLDGVQWADTGEQGLDMAEHLARV